MDAATRISQLIDALRRQGRVDVAEVAVQYQTSEMTIRVAGPSI
jgi:DeoR/GlpR family transcriptional regulator of sugar metabolism